MKLEEVRFWALTLVMTAMIWVVADQHVTRTMQLTVPYEIVPELDDVMSVRNSSDARFLQITFSGPNRSIGALKSREETIRPRVPIPSSRASGAYKLNMLDELRSLKDQFVPGVVVSSVDPESLDIQVDRYVTRVVPIRLDTGELEFEGKLQLDPATIAVVVPEMLFEKLDVQRRELVLPVAPAFKDAVEGVAVQKVLFPQGDIGGIKPRAIQPDRVTVSGTLRARSVEGRIPTVPIKLLISNDLADRYSVVFGGQEDIVTRELLIRGPGEVVQALGQGTSTYEVRGYIEVTRQDYRNDLKDGEFVPKRPQFDLPPGVELVQEPDLVDIRLVPRQQP